MFHLLALLGLIGIAADESSKTAGQVTSIVESGKRASALVVLDDRKTFGTAFCVHNSGYFITNHHVVEGQVECELILYPSELSQETHRAKVIRTDTVNDLALLRVDGALKLTALSVDPSAPLLETDQVMAFGYPFGTALALREKEYPAGSVLVGRITAIRKKDGIAEAIQIDAQLNPGNSGGPVVSSAGRVIGIVQSGIRGTGLNYAIPAHNIHRFLDAVEIRPNLPEVIAERESVTFTVTVDSPMKPLANPEVVLDISSALTDHRRISMTSTNGQTFEVTLIPVMPTAELNLISAEAEFINGTLRCQFPKVSIQTDTAELKSTEISSIELKSGEYVITKTDKSTLVSKSLNGLPKSIPLGEMTVEIDFLSATNIVFSSGDRSGLEVTIRVLDNTGEVSAKTVTVPIKGRSADEFPASRRAPSLTSPAEFAKLGESRSLPGYLTTSDAVTRTAKSGIRFSAINSRNNEPAGVIQTKSRHYLEKDFVFDVLLEFERGDRIAYVGIGAGKADQSYNGLTDTVYLRFHAPDLADGKVDLQNWKHGQTELPGKVPNWGINRVRVTKEGEAVSFYVDPQNDGPTDDDLELTIPNLREFSPYLNSKNGNLFLAGSATFLATRLHESP